jgi:hypothetical protein
MWRIIKYGITIIDKLLLAAFTTGAWIMADYEDGL